MDFIIRVEKEDLTGITFLAFKVIINNETIAKIFVREERKDDIVYGINKWLPVHYIFDILETMGTARASPLTASLIGGSLEATSTGTAEPALRGEPSSDIPDGIPCMLLSSLINKISVPIVSKISIVLKQANKSIEFLKQKMFEKIGELYGGLKGEW